MRPQVGSDPFSVGLEGKQFVLARRASPVARRQDRAERNERGARVGRDPDGGPVDARDLVRIDVDPDQRQRVIDPPLSKGAQQARPNCEHHIGFRPQTVTGDVAHSEVVTIADYAPAARERDDRRLKRLGDREELGARVIGAAPYDNQRPHRIGEQLRSLLDGLRVGHRRRWGECTVGQLHFGVARPHVERRFERDGPRAPALELIERLVDKMWNLSRILDAGRPLGQTAQDGELIGQFVEHPPSVADEVRRNLPCHAQDGRVDGIRGRKSRRRVEHAWTGHDRKSPDAAGRLCIAERHVRGALLVPGMDDANGVVGVVQSVEERVVLDSRDRKEHFHAVALQHRDEGFPARQTRHSQ